MNKKIVWVGNTRGLEDAISIIKHEKEIAIDLEYESFYTYKTDIVLMQIGTCDSVFLIDILNLGMPMTLYDLMVNNNIIKVFQDFKQDLALLAHQFNCYPKNLCDISIADRILREDNHPYNMKKMIKYYLNMDIPFSKSTQKSRWSKRPLTDKQMYYASHDVAYIIKIKHEIDKRLGDDPRKTLMIEYFRNYRGEYHEVKYNVNSMFRIKGIDDCSMTELRQIRELLLGINEFAKMMNIPFRFIISDQEVYNIVKSQPKNRDEFRKLFVKRDRLTRKREYAVNMLYQKYIDAKKMNYEIINDGSTKKWVKIENNWNKFGKFHPNRDKMELIRKWQVTIAKQLRIPPEIILDRSSIGFLSSLDHDEIEDKIKFLCATGDLHKIFVNDLLYFMDHQISKIRIDNIDTFIKNKITC